VAAFRGALTGRRYDALAAGYDARWEGYVEGTIQQTLDRVDLEGATAILDVGCGTGTLLAKLAAERPSARLTGVDLSPAMLERARGKLDRRQAWIAGDAARLPFHSGSFDLALSLSALHFWRDPSAALSEIHRVLRPGGRVAITDWCADRWIDRLRDRILQRIEPAHFRVHRAADLAAMLAAAGFREVRVERFRLGWRWGLMTGIATRADRG
jgi:ubiquinone/menaquinone biosynthesis C-methylase UbiE